VVIGGERRAAAVTGRRLTTCLLNRRACLICRPVLPEPVRVYYAVCPWNLTCWWKRSIHGFRPLLLICVADHESDGDDK
jgi:hypothetical protein